MRWPTGLLPVVAAILMGQPFAYLSLMKGLTEGSDNVVQQVNLQWSVIVRPFRRF